MHEELKIGNTWCFVRLKNKVWMFCTSKKHSLSKLKQTTWSVKCKVFCKRFRCEREPHKFERLCVKSNETIAFDEKGKKKQKQVSAGKKKERQMLNQIRAILVEGTLTIEPSLLYRELLEIYCLS